MPFLDPVKRRESQKRTNAKYALMSVSELPKSRRPEYKIWSEMIRRCYCKESSSFKSYGAKGVTVCDRWLNSFDDFLSDMGHRPSANHSINRLKNELPYMKENCEWATDAEQRRNKTTTIKIAYDGKELTISEWADIVNIKLTTLYARAKKLNAGCITVEQLFRETDKTKSSNACQRVLGER